MDRPKISPKEQALQHLETELFELWGHLNAATYRFLELLAQFDRQEGWARHGVASCAHWLNWQCGISQGAAREKVRVARALEKLPMTSDACRRGAISYSKARAMTRIATPENEAALLNIAEHGTAAHMDKLVRKYSRVERLEDTKQANDRYFRRYLRFTYDDDDSLLIYGRLPPEIGAVVRKAIDAAVEAMEEREPPTVETRSNVSAETSEVEPFSVNDAWGAKRADALRHLADSFLTRQAEAAGSSADRHQVVVHIDQRLLASAPATPMQGLPQRCELEDERVLAVETARRLSCDSSLVGIVEDDDGEPLNVGRKTRSISPALQRALKARDGGCRFPGCDRTSYTEGHHVQHWANGGETKLGNLVTLCRFHHRLVHEGGFGLRLTDDGVFVFTRPDGSRVNENGNMRGRLRGDVPALFAHNKSRGLRIDAETIRCKWLGERMDYSLAVGYLMDVREPRGYAASGAPPDHPS
jgi:Domain of unknown function (DUF222)/HNH endonuclease